MNEYNLNQAQTFNNGVSNAKVNILNSATVSVNVGTNEPTYSDYTILKYLGNMPS